MTSECPDEGIVARFVDGTLGPAEREAAEAHFDRCPGCRELMAEVARALDAESAAANGSRHPTEALARRRPLPILQRGTAVGRYILVDAIGAGGMGIVYSAYDPELDRKVAIKFIHVRGAEATVSIRREAQAMARLSHPNVVAVYDVGTFDGGAEGSEGRVFVAMEFVDGRTLSSWRRGQDPSWREVLRCFEAAGRGLAAAHAAGVVHGDFKPQNVLIGSDGRVRVSDFGLASTEPTDEHSHKTPMPGSGSSPNANAQRPLDTLRAPAGTPAYMAPEQFEGSPIDARSDVYSFCVSLYEALYGERPFAGDTATAIFAETRAGRVHRPISTVVPAWLRQVVLQGLRYRPADRFPSMEALLGELARDPAVRRRRTFIAVAAPLLIGASVVALRALPDPVRACRDAPRKLAGIWDAPRRSAIHAAFAATHMPYAEDAWREVEVALNRFSADWAPAYIGACETSARGDQPNATAYLRMACLSRELAEAQAKSDLFAHADDKVVVNAVAMARSLDLPSSCTDAPVHGLIEPPASDKRLAVEQVRRRLAEAKALEEAARYAPGLEMAQAAVADARALGYRPVEAEALYQLGALQDAAGESPTAIRTLEAAALAAEASGHDALAANAWILLLSVGVQHLDTIEQVEGFARQAQAAVERMGNEARLLSRLLNRTGCLDMRFGRLEQSLAAEQRALALREQLQGDEREVAWILNDTGDVLYMMGRFEEAVPMFTKAVRLKERALGPMHPDVGISLSNMGSLLTLMGRYDEAASSLARAMTIFEPALPPDHFLPMNLYLNLGDLALARAEYGAALGYYQRSLQIVEHAPGWDRSLTAEVLTGVGRALTGLHRPREALPYLERALTDRRGQRSDPAQVASAQLATAEALAASGGDLSRARELAQKARSASEAAGPMGRRVVADADRFLAAHGAR